MGISIREALKLELLAQTRIIAGENGLDRTIRWVNILEVLDEISFLQEGELLVTTAFGLADSPKLLDELIPYLVERKLAGLAIQTGFYLHEIPAKIIKQCNDYNFPLLELPPSAAFNEITKAILKKVINKQVELLEYAQKIHHHFTHVVLKDEGIPQIACVLAELIEAPVRIFDRNFNLLAFSNIDEDSPQVDPETISFEYQALKKAKILGAGTDVISSHLFIDNSSRHIPTQILSPLKAGNEIHGYISVLLNGHNIGEMDFAAISSAATTCTLEMLKEKAVWEAEERIRGDFLDDLIEAKISSEESLYRRANYLGCDLSKSFTILCIDIDNFTQLTQVKSEAELQEIKQRLFSLVRTCLLSEGKQFLLKYRSDKIIVLLQVEHGSVQKSTRNIAELIRNMAKKELPLTLTIGIGQSHSDLKYLPQSYTEAQQAVYIGKRLRQKDNVLFFEDLGVYRLFTSNKNQEALLGFFQKTVAALHNYDKKHNTELMPTLEAFLQANGGIKETAERLFVHRHTLRYRLNRIKQITELDPEDCHDRFQLQLGLVIARLLSE